MKSITMNAFAAGLVLAATLVPGQVLAWQNHRESTTAVVTKDPQLLNKGPIAPPSFVHPRPLHRPFASRPFVHGGTVIYSAPPVYYAPPTYSYDPPVTYYVPPSATYYPPAASIPPAAATAPAPGVVEYPHGRYELHGDGVNARYTWVWIPNAPSSPPPAAPPTPPAPAAPPEPSASDGAAAAPRSGPLYRWTDEQGAVHWTDRFDAIPEQYRPRAKQVQPS